MNRIDETIQLARLESGAVEKIEEPYSNSTRFAIFQIVC